MVAELFSLGLQYYYTYIVKPKLCMKALQVSFDYLTNFLFGSVFVSVQINQKLDRSVALPRLGRLSPAIFMLQTIITIVVFAMTGKAIAISNARKKLTEP